MVGQLSPFSHETSRAPRWFGPHARLPHTAPPTSAPGSSGAGRWRLPPIVESLWSDDTTGMPQIRISFRRPASLAPADLSSWLASQDRAFAALSGRLASEPVTSHATGADHDPLLLHVSLPAGTGRTADHRITELLADMRMLGLNPQVAASDSGAHHAPTERPKDSDTASSPPGTPSCSNWLRDV